MGGDRNHVFSRSQDEVAAGRRQETIVSTRYHAELF